MEENMKGNKLEGERLLKESLHYQSEIVRLEETHRTVMIMMI